MGRRVTASRDRFREWAAGLSRWQVVGHGLLWAVVIEFITATLRIGGGLTTQAATPWLAQFTFGLRIHHGYFGLLLLLVAALSKGSPARRNPMWILGIALVVSDALHHFVVLWIYTGAPHFDLVYH